MNEWLLIAGMALVTFAIRYPLLLLVGRVALPAPAMQALRYVPPAVLAAIIAPAMLYPNGTFALALTNPYLLAGAVAFAVAWWRKNLLLTIVIGMAALWGFRALIGA